MPKPKLVVSASCGVEPRGVVLYKPLLDEAIALARHEVTDCIIVQRRNIVDEEGHEDGRCDLVHGRDHDYNEVMAGATPHDAVPLDATDPHYVLYTSGTTGLPKGVLRDTGGYAVALKWSMGAFYDTHPGDVYWAASDIGWVVGHSYIAYGPLLQGCTSVLYEGKPVGTPDAGAFWRIVQEYGVKTLFAAPTAFRAIKQVDPDAALLADYDVSSLKALFVAGERCDPATLRWCEDQLNIPVLDHWWQTELGWPGAGNALGLGVLPAKPGSACKPVPGYDMRIVDDGGQPVAAGELGNFVMKLPLPPGALATLYNNDERYISGYLAENEGFYTSGDAGMIDEDGYVHIMARTDDVINTAGHRLSTGAMEEVLMEHPAVAECAVIGVNDELKGQVPVGFLTLKAGADLDSEDALVGELVAAVRKEIGAVAAFRKAKVVQALPKTRSGKILRATMQKIANGEEYTITPTVEDATVFDTLGPEIRRLVGGGGEEEHQQKA